MNPAPRRRLGWKILGGILGVLALVVGGVAIWTSIVADRRIERMEKDLAALREEVGKRNVSRSPLRGEPLEGNAWTDYEQALAAVPRADRALINQVYNGKKVLFPDKHAELLASGDAAFDHFLRGTRRSSGAYRYIWEDGVTGKSPPLVECQTFANFGALRSRLLVEQGRAREAADLMLDLCRLGGDLTAQETMIYQWIGAAIYHIAFLEMLTILKSRNLDREDLLAMERGLEQLGREWPDVGEGAAVEALTMGYEFLKPWGSRDPEVRASLAESWRYGFSRPITEADAFDEVRAMARDLAGISRRPWADARRIAAEVEDRTLGNRNRLVPRFFQWRMGNLEMDRELRTHLQILRAAAKFRATGEPPDLDDPFGGKLRAEAKEDRLRIWSVGLDGMDGGGSGEWGRKEGKDIVLEVRR